MQDSHELPWICQVCLFGDAKLSAYIPLTLGGYSIYKEDIELENCHRIYLTQIDQEFECDVFFPQISNEKFNDISDHTMDVTAEMQQEGDITYRYKVFENKH